MGKHDGKSSNFAFLSAMSANQFEGKVYMHLSLGRIVDELASRVDQFYLCVPVKQGPPPDTRDYCISSKIILVPQPYYGSSMSAMKRAFPICVAYWKLLRKSRHIFTRGMLPFSSMFYLIAAILGRRPTHWIVGDAVALLTSHQRASHLKDYISLVYAWQNRVVTRLGNWICSGTFLCNGAPLAKKYHSKRTKAVVSTTLRQDEFHARADTCIDTPVKVVFIGFVRPEKGVEYLVQALAKLPSSKAWRLTVVGPTNDFRAYHEQLIKLAAELNVTQYIDWMGYVPYGPQMWSYLRHSDILVLPSLSEGTPRVLVEARANSLPIIATNVGGIPSSVHDGYDGLLVPPKDPIALSKSLLRVIDDGKLRRALIHNGLQSVRALTVESFVDTVMATYLPEHKEHR